MKSGLTYVRVERVEILRLTIEEPYVTEEHVFYEERDKDIYVQPEKLFIEGQSRWRKQLLQFPYNGEGIADHGELDSRDEDYRLYLRSQNDLRVSTCGSRHRSSSS